VHQDLTGEEPRTPVVTCFRSARPWLSASRRTLAAVASRRTLAAVASRRTLAAVASRRTLAAVAGVTSPRHSAAHSLTCAARIREETQR
jgi:hypothetical protein